MPEIGPSGLMSGQGKRGDAAWPKLPRLCSTLPLLLRDRADLRAGLFEVLAPQFPVASGDAARLGHLRAAGAAKN
jgi:hypothetical protein